MPLKETICGLPGALSVSESVPVKLPVCPGVKVTLTMQLSPDARVELQVFVSPKAVLAVIPVMLSVVEPKLVKVMDCAELVVPMVWSPKVRFVGDKVALGPETTPVPVKATASGLPTPLSLMVTEALRGPI